MEKRHKIFIGISLPEDVKNELVKRQERLKEKLAYLYNEGFSDDLIKWMPKENLHITLEFLGFLTDEEIASTCVAVKEIAQNCDSFSVNLSKISFGPQLRQGFDGQAGEFKENEAPKLIWVSGQKSKELTNLKNDLQELLLESVKFSPDQKEFSPHITLAKIKEWQFKTINIDERPEIDQNLDLLFTAETIEVMESVSKKGGVRYEILESCELKI